MTARQNNTIEKMAEFLAAQRDIRLGILFGSLANGRPTSHSDVDIAILADEPLGFERRIELIEELAVISGRPIDLVDLAVAGVTIARSAILNGRVLFSRDDTAFPEQLTRVLLDSADFLPYRDRILRERRHAWIQ